MRGWWRRCFAPTWKSRVERAPDYRAQRPGPNLSPPSSILYYCIYSSTIRRFRIHIHTLSTHWERRHWHIGVGGSRRGGGRLGSSLLLLFVSVRLSLSSLLRMMTRAQRRTGGRRQEEQSISQWRKEKRRRRRKKRIDRKNRRVQKRISNKARLAAVGEERSFRIRTSWPSATPYWSGLQAKIGWRKA